MSDLSEDDTRSTTRILEISITRHKRLKFGVTGLFSSTPRKPAFKKAESVFLG